MSVYLDRKSRGVCTRCGVRKASETSLLCEPHRLYAIKAFERWKARAKERRERLLAKAATPALW